MKGFAKVYQVIGIEIASLVIICDFRVVLGITGGAIERGCCQG